MLTPDEIERYKRQLVLKEIGGEGQQKLKSSRVLVVGAGGLGSPLMLYLAAAGIGHIGIIDSNKVSLDNLHRQIVHDTKNVARPRSAPSSGMSKEIRGRPIAACSPSRRPRARCRHVPRPAFSAVSPA
jgi:adenylyltransferase/sulfurtransferase